MEKHLFFFYMNKYTRKLSENNGKTEVTFFSFENKFPLKLETGVFCVPTKNTKAEPINRYQNVLLSTKSNFDERFSQSYSIFNLKDTHHM